MEESAGLVVIHDNKILLVHPKGSKWYGTYSIPKGNIEKGENILTAALRETYEETGIQFHAYQIDPNDQGYVNYKNAAGEIYKKVHFFILELNEPIEPDSYELDKEEVDWCGFLTKEEAEKRISERFKPLLIYIENK
jgi:ADP-ribose pyrophosphatase YjhB (NUDIX family)